MAAPQRRGLAAKWAPASIAAVVSLGMVAQSCVDLAALARSADARDLAASIENGIQPDPAYLARFVAANRPADARGDCGDAATRSRLTIGLAALDAAASADDLSRRDGAVQDALDFARLRLACNPLDGNAWLRFAIVESDAGGPSAQAVEALELSYWSAPDEGWVIAARLPFATRLFLAGVAGFEAEYRNDLRRFADYEPVDQVASTYIATPERIKALLRPMIAGQPETDEARSLRSWTDRGSSLTLIDGIETLAPDRRHPARASREARPTYAAPATGGAPSAAGTSR